MKQNLDITLESRLMQIVVRNPGVRVGTLLGGLEGTMPRRPPGETFLITWTT